MEIHSLELSLPTAGELNYDAEGVFHKKVLPCLSVVQAIHGSYDISLDGGKTENTGEGGAFIAPADAIQEITHHNGEGGYMRAQWAFLSAEVNGQYRFEDVFEMPLILPQAYNVRAERDIRGILGKDLFEKYKAAYDLLQILCEVSVLKPRPDETKTQLQKYVAEHFKEEVRTEEIARALHCSEAQIFRYTKKYFKLSPANYVNRVRLQNAIKLLSDPDVQIKQAAFSSGFVDLAYFSRLFKSTLGLSPREYRNQNTANRL